MKRPTFFEGVIVALGASLAGSVLFTVLTPAFDGDAVLRVLIAGLGLGYVVYLLSRSHERVGRVTTLTLWLVAAGAIGFVQPSPLLYVMLHIGIIWLIRSLYFYSSVLCALADLGLNGLSLAAAVWAGAETGSVFLSIWCFFLIQALFVAIPSDMNRKTAGGLPGGDGGDRFQQAHRAAEAALRKLSTVR